MKIFSIRNFFFKHVFNVTVHYTFPTRQDFRAAWIVASMVVWRELLGYPLLFRLQHLHPLTQPFLGGFLSSIGLFKTWFQSYHGMAFSQMHPIELQAIFDRTSLYGFIIPLAPTVIMS